MLNDPTTEIMVAWIDERSGADGSAQTLHCDGREFAADGNATENGGIYLYHAIIEGLEPDTLYPVSLDAGETIEFPPIKTLKSRLGDGEFKSLVVYDTHTVKRQMTEPATFAPMAAEQVDAVFVAGDMIGELDYERNNHNTGIWATAFRDYFSQLHIEFMPQILQIPGNHEVGNTMNDGTMLGDATGTLYVDFSPTFATSSRSIQITRR
ncbi:hypothetical protein [Alkalilimnicola ehrlichii]|nr:hypothetical protein [Alkalilimnicola ehrlichii]